MRITKSAYNQRWRRCCPLVIGRGQWVAGGLCYERGGKGGRQLTPPLTPPTGREGGPKTQPPPLLIMTLINERGFSSLTELELTHTLAFVLHLMPWHAAICRWLLNNGCPCLYPRRTTVLCFKCLLTGQMAGIAVRFTRVACCYWVNGSNVSVVRDVFYFI